VSDDLLLVAVKTCQKYHQDRGVTYFLCSYTNCTYPNAYIFALFRSQFLVFSLFFVFKYIAKSAVVRVHFTNNDKAIPIYEEHPACKNLMPESPRVL